MANITPEATGDNAIRQMMVSSGRRRVEVTKWGLVQAYDTLDGGQDETDDVSLVLLGNPHLRYVAVCSCPVAHPLDLTLVDHLCLRRYSLLRPAWRNSGGWRR